MIRISAKLILSNLGGLSMEKASDHSFGYPRATKSHKGNIILLSIKRDDYRLDLYSSMDQDFIKEILRDLL